MGGFPGSLHSAKGNVPVGNGFRAATGSLNRAQKDGMAGAVSVDFKVAWVAQLGWIGWMAGFEPSYVLPSKSSRSFESNGMAKPRSTPEVIPDAAPARVGG